MGMETTPYIRTARRTTETHRKASYAESWGRIWPANNELDALRIAYAFRNSPHGVKMCRLPDGSYAVTVFNENCAPGIDKGG